MPRPARRTTRALLTGSLATTLAGVLTTGLLAATTAAPPADAASAATAASAARRAGNVVTPGDFTGYGFDQCLAPTQRSMNRWRRTSPFTAVGIYISGDSRACRSQPNLTPAWVSAQLRKGWRLLPITLGPQASCQPRFPRYSDDVTINPKRGTAGKYGLARRQGAAEASKTVAAAQALGIVAGSTLWYDLEGFDNTNRDCRESALSFLSSYTERLHTLGYVSGVYSSAGSGIKELDDARVERPGAFTLPDAVWVARWDNVANTSTSYLREDGWRPGGRVKQYRGGHDETWGGVRINIDSNFLDLGRGSVAARESHCGGTRVDFGAYLPLSPARADRDQLTALQCLLKEKADWQGRITGEYDAATIAATRAWQARVGHAQRSRWSRMDWMSLTSAGSQPIMKFGSAGEAVRRLQRALNAASKSAQVPVDGVFGADTERALRAWQARTRQGVSPVVTPYTWRRLNHGLR